MFCKYIWTITINTRPERFEFIQTIKRDSSWKIKYVQNDFNKYHY